MKSRRLRAGFALFTCHVMWQRSMARNTQAQLSFPPHVTRTQGPSREAGDERAGGAGFGGAWRGSKCGCRPGKTQLGWTAMPKYCRAPNCSNTAGQLGADNRPVSFYKFPLKDGPRLQAWLRHMGREHWVPSCHQHLCSEHFAPSCFQWRWGVRYLRPDAVPSIFSRAPPAQRQQSSRSMEKPVVPPPPPLQETPSLAPGPAVPAPGPVQLLMLGPASGAPEAPATVFLTPLSLPPAPAGLRPRASAQHPRAGLGAALGALQRRVRRLQRRHEQHQARLRALEQLARQLHVSSISATSFPGMAQLPRPEESQAFTIICGGPDIAVVLAHGPAPPTLDAKPELLDTQTPSA
ncbi:THAP domain-containing protein 8 isoform X6 [Odocoileus virginianus]|uniref:THAP domain-containing protein 8 isoform X6 n=1 Tax=Odocoileus virginianus TaxID=9874 RepID=A0ABM4GX97_ODOVR